LKQKFCFKKYKAKILRKNPKINFLKLYPWLEIPEELADQEHEECHYTQQFDILLDKQMNWTCSEREYLAGIARLSDTRIQLECCKLRTRNEGNCVEYDYEKPAGSGARVEIEYQGKLINALAVYGDLIRVRFCDLSPRPIGRGIIQKFRKN